MLWLLIGRAEFFRLATRLTWAGSPCHFDDRLQCREVVAQGPGPLRSERIPTRRLAVDEFLADREVPGVFELAQVCAEIAVGFIQQRLEPREAERIGAAQQDARAQPAAVLKQRVEPQQALARGVRVSRG